jgi:hypothetical protein
MVASMRRAPRRWISYSSRIDQPYRNILALIDND